MTVVEISGLLSLMIKVRSYSESKGAGLFPGLKGSTEDLENTH